RLLLLTGVMAACLTVNSTYSADDAAERGERSRLMPRFERLGQGARASDVIGMEVRDAANTKIGKVDELAVELESGRIIQVIVSSGGLLGVGDRLVAVPPQSFKLDASAKAFT